MSHHKVLVVGGGTAGISVAARLLAHDDTLDVAIIEPSETHYYQPLWTLVGGGVFDREASARPMGDYIPVAATWIKDRVAGFDPDANEVRLASGESVGYDYLVVAAGIQLNWDAIDGLAGNVGSNGIVSNYSYDTVESTWEAIRSLKKGRAVFTFPSTPIKCAGAPQKIMWLAEHWFRKAGVRDDVDVMYASATAGIFGVEKYGRTLGKLAADRGVSQRYRHDLVAVDAAARKATFQHLDTGERHVIDYDMIHVTPPQSAPDFVRQSPLANAEGWVEVDMHTTQHTRYPNVFSLGDCSSLPCSKTGAAIRKQAPVTTSNLLAAMAGEPLEAEYDGYASCPLVTGYGRLILAEFKYGGVPAETFPFDQAQERFSMYALKAYGLPEMYWNGMLRGRM